MIVAMILAGGTGRRFGAEKPKQFVEVFEKPVLAYTAEIFQNHPSVDCIEIVCHNDWKNYLSEMIQKFNLTKVKWIADGGKNFQDSVMNGMNRLKGEISVDDYVLVQYGASPFTSEKIVSDVIRMAREKDSAVSATPCYQLLGSRDGSESRNWIDREKCIQIACPYGFKFSYLLDVYKNAGERGLLEKIEPHTTSLIYALGDSLNLAYGNQTNIKITTRDDLDLFAGFVLASREKNRF